MSGPTCVACMYAEEASARAPDLPFQEHIAFALVLGLAEATNRSRGGMVIPLCDTHSRDLAQALVAFAERDENVRNPAGAPS